MGHGALRVDPEDAEAVAGHRWHAHELRSLGLTYWAAQVEGVVTYLGAFILGLHGQGVKKDQAVLYRNGDLSDGRKANLVVIGLGTAMHRRAVPKRGGLSVSGYLGVSQVIKRGEETGRWLAKIREGGATIYLGIHRDEVLAALAYDRAARQMHGEQARTNFPVES